MRFKKFVITFVILFVVVIVGLWVVGFFFANDFSVPTPSIPQDIKKVLVVFPHADDEVLTAGGLLSQLSKKNIDIKWIILTKGEKGNQGAKFDESLKAIRIAESRIAAQRYGIKDIIQKDYPDGGIDGSKE